MLDKIFKKRFPKDEIQDWVENPITEAFRDFLVATGENKVFQSVLHINSENVAQRCFEAKGFYLALEEISIGIEDLKQRKKKKTD